MFFLPCSPLTTWNTDTMAGMLAAILDHEANGEMRPLPEDGGVDRRSLNLGGLRSGHGLTYKCERNFICVSAPGLEGFLLHSGKLTANSRRSSLARWSWWTRSAACWASVHHVQFCNMSSNSVARVLDGSLHLGVAGSGSKAHCSRPVVVAGAALSEADSRAKQRLMIQPNL